MPEGIEFNADGELEITDPWLREQIAKVIKERREIKIWSRGYSRLDSGALLLALRSVLGREIPGADAGVKANIPCHQSDSMCPCRLTPSPPAAAPKKTETRSGVEEGTTAPRRRARSARKRHP